MPTSVLPLIAPRRNALPVKPPMLKSGPSPTSDTALSPMSDESS